MGRFRGVLLATDYDDTLYSTNATISPENRQAIEYFVAEGGKFCISTGRSYINFAIQMEKERLAFHALKDKGRGAGQAMHRIAGEAGAGQPGEALDQPVPPGGEQDGAGLQPVHRLSQRGGQAHGAGHIFRTGAAALLLPAAVDEGR